MGAVRQARPQILPQASARNEEGERGRPLREPRTKKGLHREPPFAYASAGAAAIALRTKPDLRHLVQTRTLNVVPSPASMRTL